MQHLFPCVDIRNFSAKALKPTDAHLNPMKILTDLDSQLSDKSIIIADGGDFVATAAYILRYGT